MPKPNIVVESSLHEPSAASSCVRFAVESLYGPTKPSQEDDVFAHEARDAAYYGRLSGLIKPLPQYKPTREEKAWFAATAKECRKIRRERLGRITRKNLVIYLEDTLPDSDYEEEDLKGVELGDHWNKEYCEDLLRAYKAVAAKHGAALRAAYEAEKKEKEEKRKRKEALNEQKEESENDKDQIRFADVTLVAGNGG